MTPLNSVIAIFLVNALIPTLQSGIALGSGIRTVILESQHPPGTPKDTRFRSFTDSPAINNAGHVAFNAAVRDSNPNTVERGLWSEGTGTLELVAGIGGQVSDGSSPVLNNNGSIAFTGTGQINGVEDPNQKGVWIKRSGSYHLFARHGGQAPGLPDGVNFDNNAGGERVYFSDGEHLAFEYSLTGEDVNSTNRYGIWTSNSGELELVVRSGDEAPNYPGGGQFQGFGLSAMNNKGIVAFTSPIIEVDTQDSLGSVWTGSAGNLQMIAKEGESAPGTPSGVLFSSFTAPAMNGLGQIAFSASLDGSAVEIANEFGIWIGTPNNLEMLARGGEIAPGAVSGVKFKRFDIPVLNETGQVAFQASLTDDGTDSTNDRGIWLGEPGDLSLVVSGSDQAPGTPAGAAFDSFGELSLNAAGQLAFMGRLIRPTGGRNSPAPDGPGGVNTTNDEGLWATDIHGELHLIARKGDLFEVTPDNFQTIQSIGFSSFTSNTGNGDGRRSGFNDLGQIVFAATFSDGESGVFVSNLVAVPEPGNHLIVSMLFLGVINFFRLR